ncbi:MAG: UMP kinase [Phycisphaerae bacterium]
MPEAKYKRILLKISGEALCPPGGSGLDASAVELTANELRPLVDMGVQVGLVVGGGNILRGRQLKDDPHIRRTTADTMGMLATVMNALALRDSLKGHGIRAEAMSAIPVTGVIEPFHQSRAVEALEDGKVVIFAGGTGSPFFTTDMCAALRARQIDAEALIKATKVDGVFSADPVDNPAAERYDRLSYQKVLADRLGVMDLTAISMCMEGQLPILVLQLSKTGNLLNAVSGKQVGTLVSE